MVGDAMADMLSSFRAAVYTLCQSTGDRAAAEKFLNSLKHTDQGWHILLTILATRNTWTHEERLVAASQLFAASCRGKSYSADELMKMLPQLSTSLTAATETNDLSTAGYINRTLIAVLVRSSEVNENELFSTIYQLVAHTRCGVRGRGDGLISQNDMLLRLLSCIPEVLTLPNLSMHPIRRQAIITALTIAEQKQHQLSIIEGINESGVVSFLEKVLVSPLQPYVYASETTQEAALQVIQSWCMHLGRLPPVKLTEIEIEYIHSLAAGIGGSGFVSVVVVAGGGNDDSFNSLSRTSHLASVAVETIAAMYTACCPVESNEEKQQQEQQQKMAAAVVVLPKLLNCLPGLLAAFSNTISTSSSSEPLSAAVTLLGAATAAAASAPPNTLASETTAAFLTKSLLSLLRHPDADTRIATLAIFDTWLSTSPTKRSSGCFPSVEALSVLLQQLVSCVNLKGGIPENFLTADARDLPEEAQMMRRETTDSIKLVVTALGAPYAASLLLQMAENAHRHRETLQLEACLYVANLIPKTSLLQTIATTKAEVNSSSNEYHLIDSLLRLSTASIAPTAPKLAGTSLTLLGGLAPLLGSILSQSSLLHASFSHALHTIISTLITCETRDANPAKLARNAATAVYRLAQVPGLVAFISIHLPGAVEALYTWYIKQDPSISAYVHPKYPNDITTVELVLNSLCLFGGGQAQASLLVDHAHRAEDILNSSGAGSGRIESLSLVTMHLKSVAMVLEITNTTEGESPPLAEIGKQLGQLLLHATTTSPTTIANATGDDSEKLSRSILECSGFLTAVCPDTVDISLEIIRILAKDTNLVDAALQALSTIASSFQQQLQGTKNVELGHPIACVAIEISENVFKACTDPSQNQNSEARFVALLQLLKVLLQRWPVVFPAIAENVVLTSLAAASQSWNRDICEASLELASEILNSTTLGTNTNTVPAVLSYLLAACCGGQPPYMLPSISETVYSAWVKGEARGFLQMFSSAMASPMQLPRGGGAPWAAWSQEMMVKLMNDLFSEASRKDEKRFKRVFKAFCGGKKKGTEGAPPARHNFEK